MGSAEAALAYISGVVSRSFAQFLRSIVNRRSFNSEPGRPSSALGQEFAQVYISRQRDRIEAHQVEERTSSTLRAQHVGRPARLPHISALTLLSAR